MKQGKYNVLIITGVVTSEHDPRVSEWLRTLLESCGKFKVRITEEFSGCTFETLEKYDAAIVVYDGKDTTETPFVGWGEKAEKALYDFAKSGKGVIIYHSAILASNNFSEEYRKMVGFDFSGKNGMRKSPKLDMVVKFSAENTITKGIEPSTWGTPCDDLFVPAGKLPDAENVQIVATVFDALEDYDRNKMQKHLLASFEGKDFVALPNINQDVPVVWTNTYGSGRVFCVSIGHGPDTIRRQSFVAMMCRGVEWACSGEVTIDPPDLQYINRQRTWPYYLNINYRENARLMRF